LERKYNISIIYKYFLGKFYGNDTIGKRKDRKKENDNKRREKKKQKIRKKGKGTEK
jgi:hypothetical protein